MPEAPPPLPLGTVLRYAFDPFSHPPMPASHLRRVGAAGLLIGVVLAPLGIALTAALSAWLGRVNKLTGLPGMYGACLLVVGVYRVVTGQFPVVARYSILRMLLLLVLFIALITFALAFFVRVSVS